MMLSQRVRRAGVGVLAALAALHLGWGFDRLLFGRSYIAAIDLRYRWLEGRYLLQRDNPLEVVRESSTGPTEQNPDVLNVSGYPPWSYVTGLVAAPPMLGFRAVRAWMALLDVLALAAFSSFAWRRFRHV